MTFMAASTLGTAKYSLILTPRTHQFACNFKTVRTGLYSHAYRGLVALVIDFMIILHKNVFLGNL